MLHYEANNAEQQRETWNKISKSFKTLSWPFELLAHISNLHKLGDWTKARIRLEHPANVAHEPNQSRLI